MVEIPIAEITDETREELHQVARETGGRSYKAILLSEPPVLRIGDQQEDHVRLVGDARSRIADAGFLAIQTEADPAYSGPTVFFSGDSHNLRQIVPSDGRAKTRSLFANHAWIAVRD